MDKIDIKLVTAEKVFYSSQADMVVVPGAGGDFGVLKDHSHMISTIRPGVVSLHNDESVENIFVSGGFAEVTGEGCTILADDANKIGDASEEEIEKMINEATFGEDN